MATYMSFGGRLRRLREEKRMSRTEFAEFLDIPQPSLYTYEKEIVEPSMSRLIQISKRCNVSIDWLCGQSDIRNFTEDLERMTYTLQCLEQANDSWCKEVYEIPMRGEAQ